jgi:hypothetical protein
VGLDSAPHSRMLENGDAALHDAWWRLVIRWQEAGPHLLMARVAISFWLRNDDSSLTTALLEADAEMLRKQRFASSHA